MFGNMYLTNKRGGAEFTARDQDLLVSLAATPAIAIDNARFYTDIAASNRWREASFRVTDAILADPSSPDLLHVIAAEARQLTSADNLAIGTTLPGGQSITVLISAGNQGQVFVGVAHPLTGSILELGARDGSFASTDAATDDRIRASRIHLPDVGPVIAVPMTLSDTTVGVLTATRDHGRDPFGADDQFVLTHFATQAALALELATARARSSNGPRSSTSVTASPGTSTTTSWADCSGPGWPCRH